MTPPDVTLSFKWGGKDGKWRWLAEVGDWGKAGEERFLNDAMDSALTASLNHFKEIPQ